MAKTSMKRINSGTFRCPECGSFFGVKKLDKKTLENVMTHEMCPTCLAEKEKAVHPVRLAAAAKPAKKKVVKTKAEAKKIVEEKKVATPAKKIEISDIITAGQRGVTKHQMIPAINNNIENTKAIKMLASHYPATFNGALRYVKKAVRLAAYAIVGKNDVVDNEKFELIQKLEPSRKGITYHQIIPALEHACDDKDYAMIVKIRKHFPEQFHGSLKYMAKKYHATLSAALETVDGAPADIQKLAVR